MVRWEPGAQESRDLQKSCAAAAVLCPGLQVKTPLSTVHRPPRAPQVRSPSGPTRSSARVGSSPSCPSSFHISLVMPWLKTPCSHVLGLPRDYGDRAGADMLLGPLATLAHLPSARKSGHICVPWGHYQPGNSPGSLCQCQKLHCCCSPAFHWQLYVGRGNTRETRGLSKKSESSLAGFGGNLEREVVSPK